MSKCGDMPHQHKRSFATCESEVIELSDGKFLETNTTCVKFLLKRSSKDWHHSQAPFPIQCMAIVPDQTLSIISRAGSNARIAPRLVHSRSAEIGLVACEPREDKTEAKRPFDTFFFSKPTQQSFSR